VAGGTRIDYREPAMTKTDLSLIRVDRLRSPHALIVSTAMLDSLEHLRNQWFRLAADNSGDSTHDS
jgi:hypothetical protein